MSVLKRLKEILMGEKKEEDSEAEKTETTTEPAEKSEKPQPEKTSEKPPEPAEPVDDAVDVPGVQEPSGAADVQEPEVAAEPSGAADVHESEESAGEDVKSEETEGTFDETEEIVEDEPSSEDESETSEDESEEEDKGERSGIMTLLEREENIIRKGNIDKEFSEKIKEAGGDSLEYCFQCGTCTGSCPSGRRTPYRVRQIIRKANVGLKDEIIADPTLWMCTTCYSCQERCPRKVKIVDVVKLARNEAAKAGFMAPAHKAVGSFVIKTGHGVPINDATMELRKAVGLGELPPTTHQFPEALEEVQKIIKATGFDQLIGYNWETGELE
ncbi:MULTISPECIES: CoB--CoM heterodisulfide reductase subunit C [Methanothermobacter]|uniref:H(2):CoB-CoM heterodisulfide,ferredoxin reductase subunit C n=1 Tax=Methanothermobacter wolfeii TaxID=145261 RepID=A0A9E7RVG9_METWO|nr:CoB--CoM heterodisulfide reductase subunit C [Methanothermobacter wolfeii]UXH32117.1 CoB--CoM heterodisulfide reductase subunit C [Methanothermobacter wolfeii]